MRLAYRRGAIKGTNGSARARRYWRAPASNVEGVETVYDLADAGDKPIDRRRGGPAEGRGGAPHELPPEERLSTMSIWRARQSSTIRARKALQNEGFAAFVDNVDTRARRKIHIALSFCYICPLDGSFALLDRGHHRCHRQYRQSRIVPKSSRPSSFLPYHKLEYLILAV